MRYANRTEVGSERSRNEIEKILNRYGATAFVYANSREQAIIIFEANKRRIKMTLPFPAVSEFEEFKNGRKRPRGQIIPALEQALRQRWRSLALIVKAKLEAVENGVATFEQEFLAYTMLPDGKTVGERVLLEVEDAYKNGKVKPLLLGMNL